MALSASTDWTATRTEIIKAAYRKVGLLSDETPPTATQMSNASFALNAIVKELDISDLNWPMPASRIESIYDELSGL